MVVTNSNVKSHQMLSEHSHLGSIVGTTLPFNMGLKSRKGTQNMGQYCKAGEPSSHTWGPASGSILGTSVVR